MKRKYTLLDYLVIEFDHMSSTIFGKFEKSRNIFFPSFPEELLSEEEKKVSRGLMRVNHTGEVCAQALYRSQMLLCNSKTIYKVLKSSCKEEQDHVLWTKNRLEELKTHTSVLNFFWYINAFFIGCAFGMLGDSTNLGFVEETEKQVGHDLTNHMYNLASKDIRSFSIIRKMREDEEGHGICARSFGGNKISTSFRKIMGLQAKFMTTLTYYI